MTTITKEELLEKMKAVEAAYSQSERVEMLEEINKMLKEANQEMKALYVEIKTKMEKGD